MIKNRDDLILLFTIIIYTTTTISYSTLILIYKYKIHIFLMFVIFKQSKYYNDTI